MTILVTGAAGFIGMHTVQALLARGDRVIGVDNLNPYYDVNLKMARLDRLKGQKGFVFQHLDLADSAAVAKAAATWHDVTAVVHLAGQPGVRYSLENPLSYIAANVTATTILCEALRSLGTCPHLVYASSSSVYGGGKELPFSTVQKVDRPVSLYAATKLMTEHIASTYSHLFRIPATGLRFFTVYGPYGRPDMAPWLFTDAILAGRGITLYGDDAVKRDFTYVGDIVAGILAAMAQVPTPDKDGLQHRIYNLGNDSPEIITGFVRLIEKLTGKQAQISRAPLPAGDVPATWADITATRAALRWQPTTSLETGMRHFIDWFQEYHAT